MVVRLKEAYENHIPDWVKKAIESQYGNIRNILLNANIDLAKVKINEDYSSAYLSDPNKICIFTIQQDYGQSSVLVVRNWDFLRDDTVYVNGRRTAVSKRSQKWIKENIAKFCWIDATEAGGRSDIHKASRIAMKDVPRKTKGQYQNRDNTWTSRGDVYRPDGRWGPRYDTDKSGYITDPDKYVRMLSAVDQNNYAQQVERFYRKLRSVIDYCRTAEDEIIYKLQPGESERKGAARDMREELERLTRYKERLVQYYNSLLRSIEKVVEKGNWDDEERFCYYTVDHCVEDFNQGYKDFKEQKEYFERCLAANEKRLADYDASVKAAKFHEENGDLFKGEKGEWDF